MTPGTCPRVRSDNHRAEYELVETLGVGGSGIVYKAREIGSADLAALKFLTPHVRRDPIARERLATEGRLASTLAHRNICETRLVDRTDSGDVFIAMRYYAGATVKQRLRNGPLPISEAIAIAAQVADGLAYLHRRTIAHGDLKPSNVIVARGEATILDFGLASVPGMRLPPLLGAATPGTAAYIAPEQTKGQPAGARSDMWALGVVLFEMLTGRLPFGGTYPEAIAYAIRHDSPSPMGRSRTGIPAAVERLVGSLLEKNPNRRCGSAMAVAFELRAMSGANMAADGTACEYEVAA